MWLKKRKQSLVLCIRMQEHGVDLSLFKHGFDTIPQLIAHACYSFDAPCVVTGQLYNQVVLAAIIKDFLPSCSAKGIQCVLGLDDLSVKTRFIVTTTDEQPTIKQAELLSKYSVRYSAETIFQDKQGRRYWYCATIEQHIYFSIFITLQRLGLSLVAALPNDLGLLYAIRSCNSAVFQEKITYIDNGVWSYMHTEAEYSLLGFCTAHNERFITTPATSVLAGYGLYVAGRSEYE